jgi:hypothetical protein
MLAIWERHLLHNLSQRVDRSTCFMNHAAFTVPVFEQNGTTSTIHNPSWYQLMLLQVQA